MSYKTIRQFLDKDLTLYFKNFFPYKRTSKSNKKHTVVLGIGGNKGNMFLVFKKLFLYLQVDKRVDVLKTSPILKNPPFGYEEQEDFHNAVVEIQTNLSPRELLTFVLGIERNFARKRSFANAPRTLDIDIILFDKISVNKKRLKIPHPHFLSRDSVIIPLTFIRRF